jgi:hypothetical protein
MLSLSFETKKDQNQIFNQAIEFFVKQLDMKIIEQGICCLNLESKNKSGFVNLTLNKKKDKNEVLIQTQGYEEFTKKFSRDF